MSLNLLAIIAYRVILIRQNYRVKEASQVGYVGLVFVMRFAARWPTTMWKKWCYVGEDCHIQFHMRYLGITRAGEKPKKPLFDGILIHRKRRIVPGPCSNDGERDEKD